MDEHTGTALQVLTNCRISLPGRPPLFVWPSPLSLAARTTAGMLLKAGGLGTDVR